MPRLVETASGKLQIDTYPEAPRLQLLSFEFERVGGAVKLTGFSPGGRRTTVELDDFQAGWLGGWLMRGSWLGRP